MRKVLLILAALAAVAILVYGISSLKEVAGISSNGEIRVCLGYNPRLADDAAAELAAYASVLEEEGVPFRQVDLFALLDVDAAGFARKVPALILPDGACTSLNSIFALWIDDYLRAGGSVAVIYDAGVRSLKGAFLPRSFFAAFTGVDHVSYAWEGATAYTTGGIRFRSAEAAAACGIPPGKLDDELFLCGYGYGRLDYPVARSRVLLAEGGGAAAEILAEAIDGEGVAHPAVVRREYGAGRVLYVNLPLGHLKAHDDDLPLRSLLRSFLFGQARVPHLMSTPGGRGGVVFNWHVDANDDWAILDRMEREGFFPDDIAYSIHICAGESLDEPGDGKGFDACGAGRRFVDMLVRHGAIGSHGGWYHNIFALKAASGEWGGPEIRRYVERNQRCLRSVTGKRVVEYSAPAGVHPPRMMARIMSDLGMNSYYYTGDGGSAPNRSFHEGERLSDSLVAFPVMPLGEVASLGEMDELENYDETVVGRWLRETSAYCDRERTVRLLYSHPYNLYVYKHENDYRRVFLDWLIELEQAQREQRLTVAPMSVFADFLLRMIETEASFVRDGGVLRVELSNPRGLRDQAVALPEELCERPDAPGLRVEQDDGWYYVVVEDAVDAKTFTVDLR